MAYTLWLCLVPLVLLLGLWVLLSLWPVPTSRLVSRPNPAGSYAEALKRLLAMTGDEASLPLHALCATRLLDHGHRTERVVLLLHGYANCPEQLGRLAELLYEQGANVLIPRMPYHGQAGRALASIGFSRPGSASQLEPCSDPLGRLTAEDLAAWAEQALDIACGLGEHVELFGFSAGGLSALWLAQNRPEVDLVVTLSAFLGVRVVPAWLHRASVRLFLILPHHGLWWDPARRAASPYSVEYSYPLFSLHDLAQALRLATLLDLQARRTPPAAGRTIFLVNESDPGVSNRKLLDLAARWQAYPGVDIRVEHFRGSQSPMHDVVTPGMPGVSVEATYERILAVLKSIE